MVGVMMVRHAPSRYLKAALCNYHLCFLSFRNPLYQSCACGVGGGCGSKSGGRAGQGGGGAITGGSGGLPRPVVEAGSSGEIPI